MQETKTVTQVYTKHVGEKFHKDGSARYYPGNTIICYLTEDHPAYQAALWAQTQLKALNFANKYAFLPPSSFHMTIMGLILEELRKPVYWSEHLALDCPLPETDAYFVKQLQTLNAPSTIKMRYTDIHKNLHPSIRLEPETEDMNHQLRSYRDAVADATGVREPNHESYAFHISICYPLMHLSEAEQKTLKAVLDDMHKHLQETLTVFELGKPEFSLFDDMFAFVRATEGDYLRSRIH